VNIYATNDMGTTPKPQARHSIERRTQALRTAIFGAIVPRRPTVWLLLWVCAMIPIRNARRPAPTKPMAVRMPIDEIKRRRLERSVRVRMMTIKMANAR
jgi:hypothetical protein